MKFTFGILLVYIALIFTSCQENKIDKPQAKPTQSYTTHSPTAHQEVALEVLKASKEWIQTFNQGNAAACVAGYKKDAVLRAIPFGLKKGEKEITEFWTPFMASGASNLVYTNVAIEVVNEKTALLSANWSMNVGYGVIYQEKWEKEADKWLLSYDDFQVVEQYDKPRESIADPVASHVVLEEVLKTSIAWTNDFNAQKGAACADGYTSNATLNAVPFASVHSQEEIKGFWEKLISDGATNLTYHNLKIGAMSNQTVQLSSNWSMNIGEGKIYQEKWIKEKDKWLLNYDEFEVLKQY